MESQPKQRLADSTIKQFIAHDDDRTSIYLFLRTAGKRGSRAVPYTFLGQLRYLVHDRDRQQPVYYTWQILDWAFPETTDKYQKRPPRDYAEQDAKNGCPQVSLWSNNSVSIMTETQRPYS